MMPAWNMRNKGLDYALIRKMIGQWRQTAPYWFGDFYPLGVYSTTDNVWMAWQLNCPEKGEGMVQAFRRQASIYESIRGKLRGLEPDATYIVKNFDSAETIEISGRELMDRGLPIVIREQPGAVVVTYKKKP
jgi:alpha-galactosidase